MGKLGIMICVAVAALGTLIDSIAVSIATGCNDRLGIGGIFAHLRAQLHRVFIPLVTLEILGVIVQNVVADQRLAHISLAVSAAVIIVLEEGDLAFHVVHKLAHRGAALFHAVVKRAKLCLAVLALQRGFQNKVAQLGILGQQGAMAVAAEHILIAQTLGAVPAVVAAAIHDAAQRLHAIAKISVAGVVFKGHHSADIFNIKAIVSGDTQPPTTLRHTLKYQPSEPPAKS